VSYRERGVSELRGNWNYPTAIRFGAGRIVELADACAEVGIGRPLLVTDRGLAANAMIAEAAARLRSAGLPLEIFADVAGDPTGEDVARGIEALKDHKADGVIAFGGGSALDAGKAIAFAARQARPLWDFEDIGDNFKRADSTKILPVIAVPTTAGTGSEVGRASVIKDVDAGLKRIIFHPAMMPRLVLADPALTIGLPPAITAAVGMDALSHNLEAYFAPAYHPFARGLAVEGARMVRDWLPTAVAEPANIAARSHMLAAAEAGAAAFQRGLGAMHALAHPLGAIYGVHHGLLNAVLMPYVLIANRPAIEADAAELARLLAVGESFDDLLACVLALRARIGIPETLGAVGVPADGAARIAAMAVEDPSAATNPIRFTAEDYAAILATAI
jgi:alcohol dehydrogenase class IV